MKSISKRKIEVGIFPIVILLGIACGLMFCSFLLGFSAGNKVGFGEAREDSLKRMAKLPIGEVIQNDITKLEKSEVYTKLQRKAEMLDESLDDSKSESLLLNDLLANKKEDKQEQAEDSSNAEVETIGSLIKKNKKKKENAKENKIELVENKIISKKEKKIVAKKQEKKELKKVPAVSKKSYIVKVIPKGWYAQVAAPTTVREANSLADKLHSSGFRLVVEKAVINGNTYFRVLVGSEKNRTQTLRLVDQLVREPYIKTTPFVRKIS